MLVVKEALLVISLPLGALFLIENLRKCRKIMK